MKAIALLVVLITLAVGTYLNRSQNESAGVTDTVKSGQAAPTRSEVPAADKEQHLEYPEKTNMPL